MLAILAGATQAQDYPTKPVRWILSFGAPGGTPDIIARLVGPKLTEIWGKQVVVDPRSGAGGILGTDIAAKSAPDGYTMVLISPAHAINATLHKTLPYDSVKDFIPVTQVADVPNIVTIYPQVAARSVKELIALARAKPGELIYGSAGVGSSQHLAGELFKKMAGVDIAHVPYKGGAAVVLDLIAGRIQLTFGSNTSLPHIRAGRLVALAVTSSRRSSALPDLPTVAEAALPGYEASAWYGVLVPARTPAAIVAKLHRDLAKVLALPDVREQLIHNTIEPTSSATPQAFRDFLAKETTKWSVLIKESGAKAD